MAEVLRFLITAGGVGLGLAAIASMIYWIGILNDEHYRSPPHIITALLFSFLVIAQICLLLALYIASLGG